MRKNPLVSVIIPVYNEEKYIAICLSSLTSQTYSKLQIIVVDDGSTDKSFTIAKKYPVILLQTSHLGTADARNSGAKIAKGDILVFADADMKYDKHYIEALIKPIIANNVAGTFNKEEYVENSSNIWSRCWSINAGLPINRRLPKDNPSVQNVFRAINKKYFDSGGGFESGGGYFDDSTLGKKLNRYAVNAVGAKSFHYNPSTLTEVFYSARWIGRGNVFTPSFYNLIRFSPFNSLRVGIKYIRSGAPMAMIVFRIVYDFGMACGIFLKTTSAK